MLHIKTKMLSAYSTAAVAFLLLNKQAESQVIYTDIDPDTILDEKHEVYEFDIDLNGTLDFFFVNNSFTYFNTCFFTYPLKQDILVGPEVEGNAAAGIYGYNGTCYGGGFTRYYPYAFNANAQIDSKLKFYTSADVALLGIRTFVYYAGGDPNKFECGQCEWYGYFVHETRDKYLGLRFLDSLGQNHYGWVRCDVLDEGRTLIIKDYAYQSRPDFPILAGAKTDTINLLDATVYTFANNLYINTPVYKDALAKMYAINGDLLFSCVLQDTYTTVNLQKYAAGIYVVVVTKGKENFTKKVFVGR